METEIEQIKKLYIITEMTYIKERENRDDLFPIDWYSSTDYIKKIEILGEAIKKNILIVETEKYKEYLSLDEVKGN